MTTKNGTLNNQMSLLVEPLASPSPSLDCEKDCPDGPRYKALGNSMAVPVMRWIGERIDKNNQISLF